MINSNNALVRTLTSIGKSSFAYTIILLLLSLLLGYHQFHIITHTYYAFNYGYIFIYHKFYITLFSILSLAVIITVFEDKKFMHFILFLTSLLISIYIYIFTVALSFIMKDLKKTILGHFTLSLLLFIFYYTTINIESKAFETAAQDINIISAHDLGSINNIIFIDSREIKTTEENTILYNKQEKIIDINSISDTEFTDNGNYIFFCDGVVCGETLHKIAMFKTEYSFNAYYLMGGIK